MPGQALPAAAPSEAGLSQLVAGALAAHGFEPATGRADYLVSIASATRRADIDVATDDCEQDCLPPTPPMFPWFGRQYLHQLTVRIFALPDGKPVYKVTAVKRDRNADAQAALPYLVASALAQLPQAGGPRWRVKLDVAPAAARALPRVVSVAPVAPVTPASPQ